MGNCLYKARSLENHDRVDKRAGSESERLNQANRETIYGLMNKIGSVLIIHKLIPKKGPECKIQFLVHVFISFLFFYFFFEKKLPPIELAIPLDSLILRTKTWTTLPSLYRHRLRTGGRFKSPKFRPSLP